MNGESRVGRGRSASSSCFPRKLIQTEPRASFKLKTLNKESWVARPCLSLHHRVSHAPSGSATLFSTLRGFMGVNHPCRKYSPPNTLFNRLNCLPIYHLNCSLLWNYTSTRETNNRQERDYFLQWLVTLRMPLLCGEAQLEGNKGVWAVRFLSLWSYHPWGHWDSPNTHSCWSIPWLHYYLVFMTTDTSPYYTHELIQLYF